MGLPACFLLAERVFPLVRALAAHDLRARGWRQSTIADAIGLSQAQVSKMLAKPRPTDVLARQLAEDWLLELTGSVASSRPWCELLQDQEDADKQDALRSILSLESMVLDANLVDLVPLVGLNLAVAIPGARGAQDVLAYPARFVAAGTQVVRPVAPAWGASRHLAAILLKRQARAAANLRASEQTLQAAKRIASVQGLRAGGEEGDAVDLLAAEPTRDVQFLHDPGAHGLEPALYVLTTSADDLGQTLLRLHELMT